jgi:hypothetical protein
MMEHGIRLMTEEDLQIVLVHALQRGAVAVAEAIWKERSRRRYPFWQPGQNLKLVA